MTDLKYSDIISFYTRNKFKVHINKAILIYNILN